ncbi:MAG TPA: putative Ig domain-containing protein [Terriglobales bacterium]|nr:putative Ig domain-containing protein [Terriglobales bacterium]
MPPKLVRLWPRVRVTGFTNSVYVTSLVLVFSLLLSLQAAARRLEKTTTTSGTRLFVSATLPQGKVGTPYVGALGVRGGVAPYSFTETGSLPAGIVLNASTGAFSGTPTASGIFYFTARVADSVGNVGDRRLYISIAPAAAVTVQVSPTSATVNSGATQQFSAIVSGSTNTNVTWSTSAGSISSTGVLTAPSVTAISYVTVTATSAAAGDSKASAIVTVNPPTSTNTSITVSLNPTSATITSGGTQQFLAAVSGTSNTSVIWSASAGSISTNGLLTAPSVSASTSVTITAKSAVHPDSKAYATVAVNPSTSSPTPTSVSVNVTPGSAVVQTSGTVQFSASVSGSTNTGVTWKAGLGTINSSGLYTAPTSGGTDTVIATSQADTTKAASATVTVQSSTSQNTGGGSGTSTPPNPAANAYCSSSGTWTGATTDGPASLPTKCMYTPVSGTPSPGTVRGPDSSTTAVQADINAAACGDTILVTAGSSLGTISLPAKKCDNAHWITIKSTGVSNASFPAEGVRMTPCWSGIASMPNRPAYSCPSPQVLTFKIVTPGSSNGVSVPGGDHYRIIGAEITRVSTGGVPIYNLVDLSTAGTQTNNIIFDRVWFHGIPGVFPSTSSSTDTSTTRAIYLGQSNHIAVIDSYFSDFYDTGSMSANGNTDAQCIGGGFGSIPNTGWGVYKFVNNHCEASGEGFLLGGSSGPPLTPSGCSAGVNCNQDVPTDLEVRQNYFFKPQSWNGNTTTVNTVGWPAVKNGFEMKIGARALFEGNVIENTWYSAQVGYCWSTAPKNQSASSGGTLVGSAPTALTNDFTYRYNYCYNTAYGIGLYQTMDAGCASCQAQGANRISIHDNVIGDNLNLGNLGATTTGDGMEFMSVPDSTGRGLNQINNVNVSHNTVVKAIRSLMIFGASSGEFHNWTLQNNLWVYGMYGVGPIGNSGGCDTPYGWGSDNFNGILNACVSTWAVDHNAVFNWNGGTAGVNWPSNGTGSGNSFFTGTSGVGFTNYGTGNSGFNPGNYALATSSTLHNAGTDGKDIGADISTLLKVIAGVRQ